MNRKAYNKRKQYSCPNMIVVPFEGEISPNSIEFWKNKYLILLEKYNALLEGRAVSIHSSRWSEHSTAVRKRKRSFGTLDRQ
jgi:hypothetical protein